MFKNALLFRFGPSWTPDLSQLEASLCEKPFIECGLTQERSTGWVAPRGEVGGALVESVGGQWVLKLMHESKSVPASAIARKVDEHKAQILTATGRKPGKKESKELKEQVLLELLPQAFSTRSAVNLWIDPEARSLLVDVSSLAKADGMLTLLNAAMPNTGLQMVQTKASPSQAMANWLLSQEPPAGFSIDRECELKAPDESKATVRYASHALDIEEIQQHIQHGKVPTKLAMTWEGKVSFVLNDKLQVSKLSFVDGAMGAAGEGQAGAADVRDDRFDADVAIATGTIKDMIPALMEALGGEMLIGDIAASDAGAGAALETPVSVSAVQAKAAHAVAAALPLVGSGAGQPASDAAEIDPLYEQAVTVVRTNQKASISLVQRHLSVGYNRAAKLLEAMETQRKVSPMDAMGVRQVLMAA